MSGENKEGDGENKEGEREKNEGNVEDGWSRIDTENEVEKRTGNKNNIQSLAKRIVNTLKKKEPS